MTPSWTLFEPLDVLLFRDGRPFLRGESNRARSIFPPLSTTLQGAIRSRIMVDHPGDPRVTSLLDPDSHGSLCIKGPFLVRDRAAAPRMLLPLPRDLLVSNATAVARAPVAAVPNEVKIGHPKLSDGAAAPLRPLVARAVGEEPREPHWITPADLAAYLDGAIPLVTDQQLTVTEPRVGISRGTAGTVEEDGLFTVEYQRLLPGVGIAAHVSGIEDLFSPSGTVRLGGEGRAAAYRPLPPEASDDLDRMLAAPSPRVTEAIGRTGRMKVYLATPSLLCAGWYWHPCHQPKDGCDATGLGVGAGNGATLVGAAVGKAQPVSGWDLKRRQARPVRQAVPAGSVYFFELDDGARAGLPGLVHGKSLSCHFGGLGFGLAFVGTW